MQVEGLRGNSTGGWGEYSFIHSVFTEHPVLEFTGNHISLFTPTLYLAQNLEQEIQEK